MGTGASVHVKSRSGIDNSASGGSGGILTSNTDNNNIEGGESNDSTELLRQVIAVLIAFIICNNMKKILFDNAQSSYLLNKFRNFISKCWCPDSAADPCFKIEGPKIAVNFLDFCCDVNGE